MTVTHARVVLVLGLLVLAAVPWRVGANPGVADEGNWVLMDGTVSPARVTGRGINGTYAHIDLKVADNATYELRNPLDGTLGVVTAVSNYATFEDKSLAENGWYRILKDGVEVTKFKVQNYTGSITNIASYDVVKMRPADIDGTPGVDAYTLDTLRFDDRLDPDAPTCNNFGGGESDQTATIPRNTLRKLNFELPYRVFTNSITPVLGLKFESFGRNIPDPPPNVGNNVVWILTKLIAPPDTGTTSPFFLFYAFVHISTLDQVELFGKGRCEKRDVANNLQTFAETRELKITVNVT